MLRRAGFRATADRATVAATPQAARVWIRELEKRLRGVWRRRLTRLFKPGGGSTLPSRRRVSSISEFMVIASFLPAPAWLRARAAHGTAGSGWSIRWYRGPGRSLRLTAPLPRKATKLRAPLPE